MTIETILPGVMSECGLDVSAPDISSNTYQMQQILALMNAAGKDINTRVEWSGSTITDDIVGDATQHTLASDFQRIAGAGSVVMNDSPFYPARPVTDESMWQFLSANPPSFTYYHIMNGAVFFSPAVGPAGAKMVYISNNWVSGKSAITENGDQPVFPEDLLARGTIWRWRRQKGLPFDDLMAEFEADLQAAIQADRGAK